MDSAITKSPVEIHTQTVNEAVSLAASKPETALTSGVYEALAALSCNPNTSGLYQTLLEKLANANKAYSKTEIRKQVDTLKASASSQSSDAYADELVAGVEPWPESVDGDELGRSIYKTIKRHCVLSDSALTASVLWVISSYAINAFRIFPKLGVSSPQKRCGKTTYLETVSAVCNRSLITSNITAAVLFRVIEDYQPTLIIDEMDTFIDGNDQLRGIINSGHTRKAAYVMRIEGENLDVKRYCTWAPNILAKIGAFPDTIADRVVMVELQRKLAGDIVERIPHDLEEQSLSIRRQCQRWANDNFEGLSQAVPQTPRVGNDRAEDNWLPLLATADLLGNDWPDKARTAMRSIQVIASEDDTEDLSILLLKDIQKLIARFKWQSVVHSSKLVDQLNAMDERPWPTLRNDKGISAHKLASLLKPFGLRSGSKRNPATGENLKGYPVDRLVELFNRYLPEESGSQTVTPSQASSNGACSNIRSVTPNEAVTDANTLTPARHKGCDDVTVEPHDPSRDKILSKSTGGIL